MMSCIHSMSAMIHRACHVHTWFPVTWHCPVTCCLSHMLYGCTRFCSLPNQNAQNTGTGIGTNPGQIPLGAALHAITGSPKSESLVLYHILPGYWEPDDLLAAGSVNSLLGVVLNQSLPLTFYQSPNDSSVVMVSGLYGTSGPLRTPPDVACNGLLYQTIANLAPTATMSTMPEISTEVDAVTVQNAPELLAAGYNFSSKNPTNWTTASLLESLGVLHSLCG